MNGVSKKKIRSAAKGAFSASPIVAEASHGPSSPKLEGLAEAILSSSTGVRPSATEEPLLLCQSDIGVNTVSECVRSSIRHERCSSTRELPNATDLVLGPDSNLRTDRDHLVLCSSSHGARLVQVSESPSALLHSQRTVNSCAAQLGYDFASPHSLVSSPGGLLSGSHLPSSCDTLTSPHEPVQTRYFHTTLGSSQSVDLAYPKCTHDSRPASACIHPDSSVPIHVASQPSLVPLPSIYWLLFDRDEHSIIGGRNGTLRGSPLSPPGELGGSGVAVASQASATPVSFLARWEDILTLERNVRSPFVKNLWRARQAQSPELTYIEHDDLGASLTNSGRCFCASFSALQYRAYASMWRNKVTTPQLIPGVFSLVAARMSRSSPQRVRCQRIICFGDSADEDTATLPFRIRDCRCVN